MKKSFFWGAGLVSLIVAIIIGAWMAIYFQVKDTLISGLQTSSHSTVAFNDFTFSLSGGYIEANKLKLNSRDESSPWKQADIGRLTGRFNPFDIFKGRIALSVEVEKAQVILQSTSGVLTCCLNPNHRFATHTAQTKSWPLIEIRKISIQDSAILLNNNSTVSADGIDLTLETTGEQNAVGSLNCQQLIIHSLQFDKAVINFQIDNNNLRIDKYLLQASNGSISGTGGIPLDNPDNSTLHFTIHQLPIRVLVPTKWPITVNSLMNGTGDYTGSVFDWQKGKAHGSLQFEQAELSALPFITKLAAIPSLNSLLSATLDEAKTDYNYTTGNFNFTKLVLTKNQLISLQGNLDVSASRELNGNFKLGIPTNALAIAPPVKEKIFNQENDGFSWTDLKITGTPDKIQEDLTPRLIALSQEEGGKAQDLINQGIQKLNDWLKK
ncbi:MAG: hypothetical protein LBH01_06445 [Verrucomicrobiales bacterium]|jgi:hypothetical protein|nr:hypothetical protein [Verrucomicrobiales bacterium]